MGTGWSVVLLARSVDPWACSSGEKVSAFPADGDLVEGDSTLGRLVKLAGRLAELLKASEREASLLAVSTGFLGFWATGSL